jgi:hypothetical protein
MALTTAVRISASISAATKELLDKHVSATGLRKGQVVEMALLRHLPADEPWRDSLRGRSSRCVFMG